MVRRIFWSLVGLGVGAVIGAQMARWANRTRARYSPPNIARQAGGGIGRLRERAAAAVQAGAEEMMRREAQVRAELRLPPA